jgi:hypothetical protein
MWDGPKKSSDKLFYTPDLREPPPTHQCNRHRNQAIWRELEATGHIADPALAVALPIEAMIHAVRTDDAVARALILRRNPVIEAVRAEGRAAGRAEGLAAGLIAIVAMRGLALDDATLGRVHGERDLARLERWIARAMAGATLIEVFAEP